jgi:Flp pilus assembly protein TadD
MSTGAPIQRSHYIRLAIVVISLIVVVLFTVLFIQRHDQNKSTSQISNSGYVDPASCANCHEQIVETYRQTGMGRSFHRLNPKQTGEDFQNRNTIHHQPSGMTYTMLERDGAFYESRQTADYEGRPTEPYEKRIDYVIGSGNHAHTYLHRSPEGKLIELPVSWYTELGGSWAMSPGYDQPSQMDFRRAIGTDCMFCHNGYPQIDQDANRVDAAIFPANLPEGIDCQRCHGPGAAHVKAAETPDAALTTIRSAILNPAHLTRDRQMDVCKQCHLETTSLPLPNSIRKYNRAPFSFKPGNSLTDYALYFDHKPGTGFDDRFEVAHQAYRLAKSKCFLKSEMTCTTCHNPHQAYRGEQAVAHYIAACEKCHSTPHPSVKDGGPVTAQPNCLTCHMWKRRTEDVVHVVMTDHYIQRLKPKSDLLAPLKEIIPTYRGEVVPYYPKSLNDISQGELYSTVAQVSSEANLQNGLQRLQNALKKDKPTEGSFYFALAIAYAKSGNDTEAIHWFDETLHHPDHPPSTLRELAAALSRLNQLPRAATIGEQAVAANPNDPHAQENLGNIYLRMGRLQDAQVYLRKALSIDPDLADANNLLGLVQTQMNNTSEAETAFRKAIQIQPNLAEAQMNLGSLLMNHRDIAQAEFYLQEAIRLDPNSSEAHRNYALLLASKRSFDQASAQMAEAIRLRPQSAELQSDSGDILVANGRIAEAQQRYRQALQLDAKQTKAHMGLAAILMAQNKSAQAEQEYRLALNSEPRNGEAHMALAEILARRGDLSGARQQLEMAAQSDDPNAREAAMQALRQ